MAGLVAAGFSAIVVGLKDETAKKNEKIEKRKINEMTSWPGMTKRY